MTKRNRIIAAILAVVIGFVMITSVGFLAVSSHHDCCGDDCPVCFQIKACVNTLKITNLLLKAVVIALSIIYAVVIGFGSYKSDYTVLTPVSLKTKLLD